jgi:hypothetical protein
MIPSDRQPPRRDRGDQTRSVGAKYPAIRDGLRHKRRNGRQENAPEAYDNSRQRTVPRLTLWTTNRTR